MSFFAWYRTSHATAYNRGSVERQGASFSYDTNVRLVCEGLNASWSSMDGRALGSIDNEGEIQSGNSDYPLYIFALDEPNGTPPCAPLDYTYLAMRLYSFRILEGYDLKRDFVPCVEQETGMAGLYDLVEGKFYGNAGSGEFLRPLPEGYTAVEYIESTAGGGQYINTGYTPHKDTKVVCRLRDDGAGSYQSYGAVFGSRKNMSWVQGMYAWLRRGGSNVPSYGRAGAEVWLDKSTFPFGDITTVTCQGRTCSWGNDAWTKTGGIELGTDYVESQEEGFAPMTIFAVNSPSEIGGCYPTDCWGFRLYSFRIFEGAELKRDFVPCVSATEGAGLWDLVEGKFYPNKGGTAFNTP